MPAPIQEVFAFFTDPANLEAITPDRLRFAVETAPDELGEGAEIAYRLRLRGIPLSWTSRIEDWDPPCGFTDVQVEGPYRRWEHIHRFAEVEEATEAIDRVRYELPGGPLGALAQRWLVGPDLRAIFRYRARELAERFG